MSNLVKQYNILSKHLNERVERECKLQPGHRKLTKEIRSIIGNGLITCGEVKMDNYPPMERNYCGCFVFSADTNHLEESALHGWEESVADSISELMDGRFRSYSVNASPIVMDSNGNDWDLFDVADPKWSEPFYARHLHFNDKRAFFQDDGSFCTADDEVATREDLLNKINELREAGGQLAMIISIQAEA